MRLATTSCDAINTMSLVISSAFQATIPTHYHSYTHLPCCRDSTLHVPCAVQPRITASSNTQQGMSNDNGGKLCCHTCCRRVCVEGGVCTWLHHTVHPVIGVYVVHQYQFDLPFATRKEMQSEHIHSDGYCMRIPRTITRRRRRTTNRGRRTIHNQHSSTHRLWGGGGDPCGKSFQGQEQLVCVVTAYKVKPCQCLLYCIL